MDNHDAERAPGRSKLLGVCAELSDRSGIAPGLIRLATLIALCCAWKLAILCYCATAVAFRLERR